jgi:ABC-type multidrug transport system fused ATPase/permease subunit
MMLFRQTWQRWGNNAMGFVMDGLDAEAYDRQYGDRTLLRRISSYFRPYRRLMGMVALLIVLNSVMDTVLPITIAHGLDTFTGHVTAQSMGVIIGIILLAGALSWTFNFFRQRYTARIVGDVVLKVREDAFEAVMKRDMSFYDEFSSGKVVSRVNSDTEDFSTVVTLVLNLLSQGLLVVLIAGVLFVISAPLALLALAITPPIVLIALGFRRIARLSMQRLQRSRAQMNSLVQETISGISGAKNFRQEQAIYTDFQRMNQQRYQTGLRAGLLFSGLFPILNTVAGFGTVIVIYFGGMRVFDGTVSAGSWFFFVQSIPILWFPLTSIASFWSQFQQGLSASERVFALIDAESRVTQHDSRHMGRLKGAIDFQAVDFRYTEQENVMQGFDLSIKAGETVAIVGHTGGGKSTLGKLIARFYEFQGGDILIDGQDIRSFDLTAYRQQLGIVPQLPFLFSGTVAENIRYARPGLSDDEVAQIARSIGGGDWLAALPQGVGTDVGEAGRSLSLGQRQLVALARLLAQDPAIIILDEATASVDPLTEAQIQEGLEFVLKGRTAIVIAHRLSTIRHADRILVLEHGRIVEEGNHNGLLRQGGKYADLYNTYFRSQEVNYRPGQGFVPVKFTDTELQQMQGAGG